MRVKIAIHNLLDQLAREWTDREYLPGVYPILWTGGTRQTFR